MSFIKEGMQVYISHTPLQYSFILIGEHNETCHVSLTDENGVIDAGRDCSGPAKLDNPERVIRDKECSRW